MTATSRKELVQSLKQKYLNSDLITKTELIESVIQATGYSRKHVIYLFNHLAGKKSKPKARKKALSQEAFEALVFVWKVFHRICGKRLKPQLAELLANLESNRHLQLSKHAKDELLSISAASIDRYLQKEKAKGRRSASHTKKGPLVKNKVPIRTFSEWKDVKPGFFEIDTVSHTNSDTTGGFISTLNMTDIATCWTLPIAIPSKHASEVIAALDKAKKSLPFPLLGIDFDNGSEFLNDELIDWCEKNRITYTRSRKYKKNDQAWIEQKNGSVVRKEVVKGRLEIQAFKLLERLYELLSLYVNFFQPSQKLLTKKRNGAKVYKKHDLAKTPYQRVLESKFISKEAKNKLKKQYQKLDAYSLHIEMGEIQRELKLLLVSSQNQIQAVLNKQRNAAFAYTSNAQDEPVLKIKLCTELRAYMSTFEVGEVISRKELLAMGHNEIGVDQLIYRVLKEGALQRCGRGIYKIEENMLKTQKFAGTKINEATV